MAHLKFLLLLLGLGFALLLTAGGPERQERDNPPAPAFPGRIVSLSPGNTEILFALGAGDRVVGVASYSDYPPEAKTKPTVGSYHAPDIEAVVALSPDIVFAVGEIQDRHSRILRQAGIRVVSLAPATMQGVLEAIRTAGGEIGEPDRAAALCAELAGQVAQAGRLTGDAAPRRVFVEIWDRPLLTAGGKSHITDIITLAGGFNVASVRNVDYTVCDPETLYAYNPEVYLIAGHNRNGRNALATRPELGDLDAVQSGRVYTVADDLLVRPGPRSFSALAQIAALLRSMPGNPSQKAGTP